MANKIKKVFGYLFDKIKDPAIIICLLISSVLWFINKLNDLYTDNITVPVVVTGALDSEDEDRVANDDKVYFIDCKFEAKGFELLIIGRGNRVVVSPEDLSIVRVGNTDHFEIDVLSLKKALSKKFPNANLLEVLNRRIMLQTTTFMQRRVPLVSNVSLSAKGEYMQIGKTYLEPDSVTIYGSQADVESVKEIHTEHLLVTNPVKYGSGYVNIPTSDKFEITPNVCSYSIVTERYTEMRYLAEIVLPEAFSNGDYLTYPAKVEIIFNVAQNIYTQFDPKSISFYINPESTDLKSEDANYIGNNKFMVEYSELPMGVDIRSISPIAITLLKSK